MNHTNEQKGWREDLRDWFYNRNPKTITDQNAGFYFAEKDVIEALTAALEERDREFIGTLQEIKNPYGRGAYIADHNAFEDFRATAISIITSKTK